MTNLPSEHDNELPEHMAVFQEPPFDPEDTPPSGVYRQLDAQPKTNPRITGKIKTPRTGLPWLNWLMMGGSLLITLIAGLIFMQQDVSSAQPQTEAIKIVVEATTVATAVPTISPTQAMLNNDAGVPADVVAEVLMQPAEAEPPVHRFYRRQTAYTIAPARSRTSIISYTIEPGDTLDKIAQKFGISSDTISWANDDIYVNRLLPGDTLTILPENGVLHKTMGEESIQSIAEKYKVSAFAIIDSEINPLQNANEKTILPASFPVFVPGGVSTKKALYWDPGTSFKPKAAAVQGGTGASSNENGEVSFGGGPGSCGYQANNGGGGLRVPLGGGYSVVRGFFDGHSGIDLAQPSGSTVFAAANGTVIFAGWSNWGYGYSVVLAHGSLLTLYGHLSDYSVKCGQYVTAGTPIGAVGSSGQSSGPHLHFEVRPGGVPVNPAGYLPF